MQVPSLLQSLTTTNQINTMRAQLTDLQTQLATGKKSQSHAGLGVNAGLVLDLRAELNVMDAYIRTIDQTQLRLTTVQQSLSRVDDIAAEMRTASLTSGYETIDTKQTQLQYTAAERLEEVLAVLNTDIGGRHLFGGAATQTQPVEVYDTVINGDVGRAGFKQIVSERAQADLGSDNRGRLQIPVPAGDTVTVTEDNAPPFGLKFDAVSTDLANVTAGIAGAPQALSVQFAAPLPTDGQTINISFNLPDGTKETLTLKAITTGTPNEGEFLVGADANATAANFQSALARDVEVLAQTSLKGASAQRAATEFFEYDSATPPQRVDGPPFDTATGLRDATTTDTVFWYKGDNTTTPIRDSATAKIDDGRIISYATRADEGPTRDVVKTLAVLAALEFPDADPLSQRAYDETTQRTGKKFAFNGTTSIADLRTQLALKETSLSNTKDRHERTINATQVLLAETENADTNEVGAKILQLQNQLTASYQVTSLVSRLTLTNYI
ncbi:hypothetical protein [Pyruvatibacter mobilis]|uniref:flagellin N-terminal helical domain-containing protein n=1 Tax=Pyruvatibacter mobilis TaxID=1712261 RepID=UPI003C7A8B93